MPGTVDVTTPSERSIQVTRTFNAPAQLVFDFHTKPELITRWLLGPPGWSMPVCEIDLKVGGRYAYRWRNDESGHEFGTAGQFREIVSPRRIIFTEKMEGMPGECVCSYTFDEANGKTKLTTFMEYDSPASRDAALQTGMTDGMSSSYDRLEDEMKAA